jgi:phospholipid/cholesterol/gamma-HCH transport system permease protein
MATTDPKLLDPNNVPASGVLSEKAKAWVLHVQEYTILASRAVSDVFTPPYYFSDVLEQMDIIGVGSLPIVLLTGFFIGAVMVLQTAAQFERFGQTALTADVVSLALVRELGPSITGLLVTGRNASGMASELGSMVVTEQVDAMRAMGTDPIRKLVTPRLIATVLMLPLLTAMADFTGLIGGYLVSLFTLRLDPVVFWTRAIDILEFSVQR